MAWSLLRCLRVLIFLEAWIFVSMVKALHADEVGIIDWHHKLIGTPLNGSTFLHKPVSGSGALAYALTDKNVLAAINLRDGTIVWRQHLEEPKLAKPLDGTIAVLSGFNTTIVTTFDAQTGHQLSQSRPFSGAPLDMQILSPDWPNDNTKDVVTLSSNGYIRRFHHLSLVWETPALEVKGRARYIATSLSKVYVAFLVPHRRGSSVTSTTLDAVTGVIINLHEMDAEITSDSDLALVGSHSAAPLAVWVESQTVRVNVLGYKKVYSFSYPSMPKFTNVVALAPHSSISLPYFLLAFNNEYSSWAHIYHTDLASGEINHKFVIEPGAKATFALAQVDANVYLGKVTIEPDHQEAALEVWSSASSERLGLWKTPFPTEDYGAVDVAVLDVVSQDASVVAARAMITVEDGSVHLLRNNEHPWTREESLAHMNPKHILFLDLPVSEPKLQLNVSTGDLLSAYVTRLTTHIKQLRNLPSSVANFARHFATGRYEEIEIGSANRDAFGLRKFIITTTDKWTVVALDSANKGNIVWRKLIPKGTQVHGMWVLRESSVVRGQPPLIGMVSSKSGQFKFSQLNGLDGSVLDEFEAVGEVVKAFVAPSGFVDKEGRKFVLVILQNGDGLILPNGEDATALVREINDRVYYLVQDANGLQGYVFDASLKGIPTWRFEVPQGCELISLFSRSSGEKVASIGRVLGDRSVLYKYLNSHILIAAVGSKTTLTIYLLDSVSGHILYEAKHRGVDISKGVHTHIVENVAYWSYYATGDIEGQSRGDKITVAELYESPNPNARFNITEWTSFVDKVPHVIAQTYAFEHPIRGITTTITRHGITSKDLLVLTLNSLISLPKRLLDPRRPVLPEGKKPTAEQKEEGLIPYEAALPDESKLTVSHVYELLGIKKVVTSPALLESTSIVFALGLDLFLTRVTPSGPFDVLGEGFNKIQLLTTIFALAVGLLVMRPLVRRKHLKERWGNQ